MNLYLIKKFCENKEGGLKRLAEEVGMSEQNLHRCIRVNKIQAEVLEKIAKELNVSVVEFFDEEVTDKQVTVAISEDGPAVGSNSGTVTQTVAAPSSGDSQTIEVLMDLVKAKEDLIQELRTRIAELQKARTP